MANSFTYGDLLAALYELSPEQLANTASVQVDDEILPITGCFLADNNQDVLDEGHPYLSTTPAETE